tara:strand:- start:1635 stop:2543 length:909 start_codon:yes stop_codon:yes gene_type:complete
MPEDSVAWYLQQAARFPLLTPSEEISLGSEVQQYMKLRDKERPTKEEKRLIRNGLKAKNRMFQANLRLVVHISKNYADSGLRSMSMMDLIQEGNIGLSRAIEKFDPSRGYKLSTYAYWWIKQAVGRSISNLDRVIRLPLNAIVTQKKVAEFAEIYKQEYKRNPTINECAEFCDVRPCTMRAYLEHTPKIGSLDQVRGDDSNTIFDSTIKDIVPSNHKSPDEEMEIESALNKLDELLQEIPERDRLAIELRYGLVKRKPMTYVDIGKELNISRERVRQIEDRWIKKMRRSLVPMPKRYGQNKP